MDAREFRLDDWLVQASLNRLVRGESRVQIRPRLMDVLCFLAEHHGEVVSKDEVIAAVWAKPYMAESVLSRSVAELRAILGDDAGEPRYIETIVKRGYRLLAPVQFANLSVPSAGHEVRATTGAPRPPGEHTCGLCWGERELPLAQGENVVGRASDAAVRLDSLQVSRRHARIVVTGGRAVLEDLGSKNGTYLRGRRVQAPVELVDGDEVIFGRVVVVFQFCAAMAATASCEPL